MDEEAVYILQEILEAEPDNKFYLIQTVYGDLGFTYYHLGIKPCIILKNDVFFMGFGSSIMIYDILWETGFRDWIFDYSIEDRMIEIRFEDAIVLSLSIKDGRATRTTK